MIPLLFKDDIDRKIADVAKKISMDYENRELFAVGVLKGAFIFLADVVRKLTIPVKIDFIRISSYGSGDRTSGKILLTQELEMDIHGKDVLVVEDIVDSGLTLTYIF